MGFFGRWKRKRGGRDDWRLADWRRAWSAAAAAPEESHVRALQARLEALKLPEDDVEIEREMLDALTELAQLRRRVEGPEALPILETGHRVVASDTCHFSAPVSMPDDPAQAAGRLILTNARAIFVGGPRAITLAWHAVAEVTCRERDIMMVRNDRETLYRFRCNTFRDALCGAFLARRLAASRRR